MRRLLSLVLVMAMMAVAMSACGAGETEETTSTTTGPDTSAPTTTGPAPSAPATPEQADTTSDVVVVNPGEPILIGYGLLTSGPNSNLGIDSMRGVEIAIEDVGGELLGHPIELVGEDTGCSPEGGQAAAQKLIVNEQIVGIIGSTCSSAGSVMAPVIDEAGMVMISPSNTAPGLTDPETHARGYLRTAHNDKVQGAVAAEYAYNVLGVRRAATIHDGSVYAEQLANVFAEEFISYGGEVVAREAINETDTDMQPVLTAIASNNPELIYYPIFMPAGGFVTSQARQVEGLEEVFLMGADGLFNPDFIEAAGEAVVGMYLSSPDLTSLGGGYQEFLDKHRAKYNEETLSVYHANAYDATMLILRAVEQAAEQDPDGTLRIPRQAVRDALYATSNYQGLTGNLTCDQYGDCADPNIVVYEIVSPDPATWNPGDPTENPDANPQKVYPAPEGETDMTETDEPMDDEPMDDEPMSTDEMTGTDEMDDEPMSTDEMTGTDEMDNEPMSTDEMTGTDETE
jgi:branched-chain amino acid transport system substrate-binding protein